MAWQFRAAPRAALIVQPLDTLTAIHHRASGQTHLLASPAPELIEALGDEALTLDALLARLAARFDLIDADAGALGARLEELVAVGLVEQLGEAA